MGDDENSGIKDGPLKLFIGVNRKDVEFMSLQHSEILYKYLWTMDTNRIESIRTMSMEDVSTRVLEKIKNI